MGLSVIFTVNMRVCGATDLHAPTTILMKEVRATC